jgi:multiple sugar transport system permease protein
MSTLLILVAAVVSGLLTPVSAHADDQKIVLHVWGLNMGYPRLGWLAAVDAFEKKYPHIEVIIGPADRGQDLQKLLSGVVGNSPPDVFKREANLFGDIAARGILMPLDEFLKADEDVPGGVRLDDYAPGLWDSVRGPDGRIYGVPEATNSLFLAYNKTVFKERAAELTAAGLDPSRAPQTWEELKQYAKILTEYDDRGRVTRWGCMISAPFMEDELFYYVALNGGRVLSPDGRTALLDTPESIGAVKFIEEIYDVMGGRRSYDNWAQLNESFGGNMPLGEGRIAMSVEGDSVIGGAMRFTPDMELGLAPMPAPEGLPAITTSARHSVYFIPTNARHPKEAWDFIRFATGPEGTLIFQSAIEDEMRAKGEDFDVYPGFRASRATRTALHDRFAPEAPNMREAYDQAARLMDDVPFVPIPNSPVYAIIRDENERAVNRVLYGQMDAETAMKDADRRVQQQLDLYYSRENLPILNWGWVWGGTLALVAGSIFFFWWRSREQQAYTNLQRSDNRAGLFFIAPWIAGFLAFIAGPMVFSLAISFCDYDVIHPARFVGVNNYHFLLTQDPLFWKSLWNTVFMVLAIPLNMTMALGIALLLNARVRGMSTYRTIFYLPSITPAIAAAVLWYALLNPDGLVNNGIEATLGQLFGINAPSWLGDARWSKPAIVLMQLWVAGGGMILWLAGLQGIPKQLYEAASIDGAGPIRQFFKITLPMLTPYMFFGFVTGIIGVFQIFAQALVLTKGGPADSTLFYVYYLFNNAFRYFKMGYASAQAWVLFVIILVLTLIQWRMSKRWVHYN